jgi:hypothetical protein
MKIKSSGNGEEGEGRLVMIGSPTSGGNGYFPGVLILEEEGGSLMVVTVSVGDIALLLTLRLGDGVAVSEVKGMTVEDDEGARIELLIGRVSLQNKEPFSASDTFRNLTSPTSTHSMSGSLAKLTTTNHMM